MTRRILWDLTWISESVLVVVNPPVVIFSSVGVTSGKGLSTPKVPMCEVKLKKVLSVGDQRFKREKEVRRESNNEQSIRSKIQA